MNRYTLVLIGIALMAGSGLAMVGGPAFVVPHQMTSMTVEGGQMTTDFSSASGSSDKDKMNSQRMLLTARYGMAPGFDVGATLGTANLQFNDLSGGYSDYTSNWSFAWGAAVRAGLPSWESPYQVIGSLNYFGFQPDGQTSNGTKSVGTKYTWHEVMPSITAGYRFASVIPYVGIAKPLIFGDKDVSVSFNGRSFPAAGGSSEFSDSEQSFRGIFGLEWKLPEGYSVTGEAAAASGGQWMMTIGLSQVLK